MTDDGDSSRSAGGRSSWIVRAAVGVTLAVLGVALLWAAVGRAAIPEPVPAGPEVDRTTSTAATSPNVTKSPAPRSGQRDVRDRISGLVLPESDPVAVSIPRLGVASSAGASGANRTGALDVPRDPATAGWFSGGAAPGALGRR